MCQLSSYDGVDVYSVPMCSPLLVHGPNVNLVGEAPLALRMQIPVALGNVVGANLRLVRLILQPVLGGRNIDYAIDLRYDHQLCEGKRGVDHLPPRAQHAHL